MKVSILALTAMLASFAMGATQPPPAPNVHNPEKAANSVGSNNYCNCAKKKEEETKSDDEDDDKSWGLGRRMVQMLGPRTCPCARELGDEALALQGDEAMLVADASQLHPNESE